MNDRLGQDASDLQEIEKFQAKDNSLNLNDDLGDYPNVLIMSPTSSQNASLSDIRKNKIMKSSLVTNVGLSCSQNKNLDQSVGGAQVAIIGLQTASVRPTRMRHIATVFSNSRNSSSCSSKHRHRGSKACSTSTR